MSLHIFKNQILRRPSLQRRAGSRSDVTHHAVTSQLPQVPAGGGSRPIGEQVISSCLSSPCCIFSPFTVKDQPECLEKYTVKGESWNIELTNRNFLGEDGIGLKEVNWSGGGGKANLCNTFNSEVPHRVQIALI